MDLEFGLWLKKRRRILDLTQDDLAARATCSVNTIRKIESGALIPSRDLALEIARALQLPPETHSEFVRFARTPDSTAPEYAFSDTPGNTGQLLAPAPARDPSAQRGADTSRPLVEPVKFQPPAPLAAAIGREHDTGIVTRLLRLPPVRLVTLTGPPGTGKTRLAIEVAGELQNEFEHGAAFVALAPIAEAGLVESAIAGALDLRATLHSSLADALRAFLRDKQILLVLDNFEHVLDAAPVVTNLLIHAPRLKVLATSRERLRVYGERELPIAPLLLPSLSPLPPWTEIENYAAVQLFVDRAQAVKADFEITPENAEAVARLCIGLDGIPLALEMAAARVKWETPGQLLPQLTRRLETLRTRSRESEPRQQTLRGAIDWSYERLEENERFVLRQLGVFRGGFTREAASAVCNQPVDETLENLVEKSLVKMESETRYTLLEMLREYALEKLDGESPFDSPTAQLRHAEFFTGVAEAYEPTLRSAGGFDLAHVLDPDRDNLRAALEWTITHGEGALALRLAASLSSYWDRKSAVGEGTRWLDRVLAMDTRLDEDLLFARAKARDTYAEFVRLNGDYGRARKLLEQALDDWRGAGERGKPYLANALIPSSRVALDQGDDDLAYELGLESLRVNTELNDLAGLCQSYRRLADWALTQRNFTAAGEYVARSMEFAEAADSDHERCTTLRFRGDLARSLGNYDAANADYALALKLNETIKDDYATIRMERSLGVVALLQGDLTRGETLIRQAAQLADTVGNHAALALSFSNAAFGAALRGNPQRAAQLLGGMDTLIEKVQMRLIAPDLFEYEQTIQLLETQAPTIDLECWRQEGKNLSSPDSLALLLAPQPTPPGT